MATKKTPEVPESWGKDRHAEIEGYGLGTGFALFQEPSDSLRGILRTFFPTKHGPAVSIELTESPMVSFFQTSPDGNHVAIMAGIGDLVNLSLTPVDLERKIKPEMIDKDVGVQYLHEVSTRSGNMKVYRVLVFDTVVSRFAS